MNIGQYRFDDAEDPQITVTAPLKAHDAPLQKMAQQTLFEFVADAEKLEQWGAPVVVVVEDAKSREEEGR